MIKERIQHLPLFRLDAINKKKPVLIVGNAYGIMPYVHPLAVVLAEYGFTPFWFAFSGQEKTSGSYSHQQGITDIKLVIDYIKKETSTSELKIISHCAGSLLTLEYLKTFPQTYVTKLIVYGLLYSMNRRRKIAERKMKQCGVTYDLSEKDWNYNPIPALSEINIPTLFCHSKDKLNLERATSEEMKLVVETTRGSKLLWFEEGYDHDTTLIKNFVESYKEFLA